MNSSSSSGFGLSDLDLRGAIDSLRQAFAPRVAEFRDAARGASRDIREAILTELATGPQHGYQLIQSIQEHSNGAWTPSPGVVYPTLQLLADEGLVTAEQTGERKVYSLTDTGKAAAAAADAPADGDQPGNDPHRRWDDLATLPKAATKLARATAQFGPGVSMEQNERAAAILDEARKKLFAILAED